MRDFPPVSRRVLGVTLVEVFFVLAVAAVLASLLTPLLQRSREEARLADCMSNLKQIGMAISLYGSEEGYFPPSYSEGGRSVEFILNRQLGMTSAGEAGKVGSRLKSLAVTTVTVGLSVACPSRKIRTSVDPLWNYGLHPMICVDRSDPGAPPLRPYGKGDRPGRLVLGMDATQDSYGYSCVGLVNIPGVTNLGVRESANQPIDPGPDQDGDLFVGNPRYRHAGRSAVLFVDEHVEAVSKGQLRESQIRVDY